MHARLARGGVKLPVAVGGVDCNLPKQDMTRNRPTRPDKVKKRWNNEVPASSNGYEHSIPPLARSLALLTLAK